MNPYIAGDMVPIRVQCQINGQPVVPSDVYLSIKVAGQPVVRYHWPDDPGPITENGVGTFTAEIDSSTLPGQWNVQGSWEGPSQAVGVDLLDVSPTPLPPPFGS